jgi:hypothetical protein
MATMINPHITSKGGKTIITIPQGAEAFGYPAGVTEFKSAQEALDWLGKFNEAQAASVAAETRAIQYRLTYRKEFQVIGPSGFPMFTVTQDNFGVLANAWPEILATFEANKGQVAATYDARPKALPKGSPQISEGKIKLEPAKLVTK